MKRIEFSYKGEVIREETQEEINARLSRELEVKEEYPIITEEQETIALLVLEIENLKTQIGGTV